jgi:hypothetical protein
MTCTRDFRHWWSTSIQEGQFTVREEGDRQTADQMSYTQPSPDPVRSRGSQVLLREVPRRQKVLYWWENRHTQVERHWLGHLDCPLYDCQGQKKQGRAGNCPQPEGPGRQMPDGVLDWIPHIKRTLVESKWNVTYLAIACQGLFFSWNERTQRGTWNEVQATLCIS